MGKTDRAAKLNEIQNNYHYYQQILPEIEIKNHGKYALLRACKIIKYYRSALDAQTSALALYTDGLYSIQKVAQAPAELGFYSHANKRPA